MKRIILGVSLVIALIAPGVAKAVDSYQVTGKVAEYEKGKSITVIKESGEKGEKFEIALEKKTKIEGEVKKDSKVTVHYKMTAVSVEAKDEGKKEEKKEDKKEKKDKK